MNTSQTTSTEVLFSVLIANYNNGKYLQQCLASILAQNYRNWEIVLVDDASTDESRKIYAQYENDHRFRFFYNDKNQGCGYTKRRCAELAKGELCGFVDPDDAITPNALEIMVQKHLHHKECSLIYSNHYICNSDLEIERIADYVGEIKNYSWAVNRPIISHFATFKRLAYIITTGIEPWLDRAVDKDLYYKLEETGKTKYIDIPLYYYRHHGSGISLNKNIHKAYLTELAVKALVESRLKNKDQLRSLMPHSRSILSGALLITGVRLFIEGRMTNGLKAISKSLNLYHILVIPGVIHLASLILSKIFAKRNG